MGNENKIIKSLENRNTQLLILAGITLFAALLRLYKLGTWSLWYDEIYTLRAIGAFPGTSLSDPGVSKLLTALAVNIFGLEEWAVRLAPALVGIVTIPVLFFPIKNMFNARVALIASLLLAVSTWHLYWSQNARFYTTLLLLSTLALITFYYGIERDKPLYLIVSLVLLGLAVRERMFTVFLVPIAAIYLLCLKFLPFKKPKGLNTTNMLILILPSLAFGVFLGWEFIRELPSYLDGFATVNSDPLWILAGAVYYIGIAVILMGIAGGIYRLVTTRDRAVLLFFIAAIVPMLSVTLLALVQYSANRYIFISLTSWIILASLAITDFFANSKGATWIFVLGVALIMLVEPLGENFLYYQYQNGNRDDWKSAFQLVDRRLGVGDLIVVTEPLMGEYYLDHPVAGIESIEMESILEGESRVWFIEDNNMGTKYPKKMRWIEENARLIADYQVDVRARVFKMGIYLFDPATSDAPHLNSPVQ